MWWRRYCQRVDRGEVPAPINWWQRRQLMLERFTEIKRLNRLRDDYDALKQQGTVQTYVAKFQSLILELPEKSEEDLVHKFLGGLKPRLQIFTRPHQPRTLDEAMTAADNAEASLFASQQRGVPASGTSNTRFSRFSPSNRSGPEAMQIGAVALSPSEKQRAIREGLYFKCMKPGHKAAECKSKNATRSKDGRFFGKGSRPRLSEN